MTTPTLAASSRAAHALAAPAVSKPASDPAPAPSFLAARPVAAASGTEILADDAPSRAKPDLSRPLHVQLSPILRGLVAGAAAPPDRFAGLLRDLAESGLLDAGVDETMAKAHGYAVAGHDLPRQGEPGARSDSVPRRDPLVDSAAVVAALAEICPASAAAVAVQRFAIEILAPARRTPANERLLKALRRGAVAAAVPAPGALPVDGELLADGSVLIASGHVRMWGSRPGAAVLLRVRLGGRVVWAWTTYGAAGVDPRGMAPPAVNEPVEQALDADGEDGEPMGDGAQLPDDGVELFLDRVVIRAEALLDAPPDEPLEVSRHTSPSVSSLDLSSLGLPSLGLSLDAAQERQVTLAAAARPSCAA